MFSSYATGRYVASEGDLAVLPRDYKADGTQRGVLWCRGGGQNGVGLITSTRSGELVLLRAVVEAGLPVLSPDLSTSAGPWGNATYQSRIGSAKTALQSTWGAKAGPVLMVTMSQGVNGALNYAIANPTHVAGVVALLPTPDLTSIYTGNPVAGSRAAIEAAWGVTYPAALPAGSDPALQTAALTGIPYQGWYATDDPYTSTATQQSFAAAVGGTANSLGALGHTQTAVAAVSIPEVIDWLRQAA